MCSLQNNIDYNNSKNLQNEEVITFNTIQNSLKPCNKSYTRVTILPVKENTLKQLQNY